MHQLKKRDALYIPVTTMKDVSSEVVQKLHLHGVKYTHHLLTLGKTPQLRETFARQAGLPCSVILALVNRADLMRLTKVGGDLSLLLTKADVMNCRDLQQHDAIQLYQHLGRVHIGQKIAYHAPALARVKSWIKEAAILAETSPECDPE